MSELQYRAYDKKAKTMVYNEDLWLPAGLKKLGHNEYPVYITREGIHYTLDCISNHYENDWEENVVNVLGIEIMPFTNYWDCGLTRRKIFSNDIISFFLPRSQNTLNAQRTIGMIKYSERSRDWIIVDKAGQFIERLSSVEQPEVIGNSFDNPEVLN